MKADGNVYVHTIFMVIILAYVDDLMVFGMLEHIKQIEEQLKYIFLIKVAGNLNEQGSLVRFLGRTLQRIQNGIFMFEEEEYYLDILKEHNMEKCKEANPPSSPRTSSESFR